MISAIMPTYNQAAFIEQALASVASQVDELLIVNDGCTDRTGELVEFAHENEQNLGTAAAINAGFAMARGDLVTWVSSDNIHAPHWRETLESAFEDDVGVVYSAFRFGIGGRVLFKPYDPKRLVRDLNCYFGPSFLIRREVWLEAGPHRGRISHDYDHWLRVEEVCWSEGLRIVGLKEPLVDYRIHDARATVARKHEFDADHWQDEAKRRRASC